MSVEEKSDGRRRHTKICNTQSTKTQSSKHLQMKLKFYFWYDRETFLNKYLTCNKGIRSMIMHTKTEIFPFTDASHLLTV